MAQKIKEFFSKISYRSLFFALLGSAIVAFATYNINVNLEIPEAGIIGLCLIIENFVGISPAISNLVINMICYVVAWRLMGTKYVLNAGIATIGFSVFYAIFSLFPPITIPVISNYPLLMVLIGAIFVEIGNGISIRYGSAPAGEHALSVALVSRGGFDFAWFVFIQDFVIIALAFTYADPYTVIYSLLVMTVTNPIKDYIVSTPDKPKDKKAPRKKKSYMSMVLTGLAIIIVITGATIYLNNYYHADNVSIRPTVSETVNHVELDDGSVAYIPEGEIKAGFVFYPGGKVEHTAYAPLLSSLAEQGIVSVVVKMPYNLAVFGINKGLSVPEQFPEVENWYIGGHSLGGSMASNCAGNYPDAFDGVVLLASYSVTDISSLRVLSVYGSCDGVMNRQKYVKYMNMLPENFKEHVIIGGNHAYFGMYGEQNGDGVAQITNKEQIKITAEYIADFILGKE